MKTVSFSIQKGGTGKTSVSVSVAVELANAGKKTLLIDADPQGNATTWIYPKLLDYELCNVLTDKCTIQQAITETLIRNLYILPTAGINGQLKEYADNTAGGKLTKFKNILKSISKDYDFCIIDTSPNFGNFEQSIFYATNDIIAVLQLDEFSKDGLQIFVNRLKSFLNDLDDDLQKPNFNKIVFNAKNDSFAQHNALLQKYKPLENNGYKLFTVPQDQAFKHAQTNHLTLNETTNKKETLQSISTIAECLIME